MDLSLFSVFISVLLSISLANFDCLLDILRKKNLRGFARCYLLPEGIYPILRRQLDEGQFTSVLLGTK